MNKETAFLLIDSATGMMSRYVNGKPTGDAVIAENYEDESKQEWLNAIEIFREKGMIV
jgi:hypothetical protein